MAQVENNRSLKPSAAFCKCFSTSMPSSTTRLVLFNVAIETSDMGMHPTCLSQRPESDYPSGAISCAASVGSTPSIPCRAEKS